MSLPKDVYEHAMDLYQSGADAVELFRNLEKIFRLDWKTLTTEKNKDWIIEVKDPHPFMAVRWLVEIMEATRPVFRVRIPQEALQTTSSTRIERLRSALRRNLPPWVLRIFRQPSDAERTGSHLARFVSAILEQTDRRRPNPLMNDLLHAGFVHGRQVVKLVDLRQNTLWQEQNTDEVDLDTLASEWSRIKQAPFAVEIVDGKTVFPEWDTLGLCALMQRNLRKAKEIERDYNINLDTYQIDKYSNVLFTELWTREKKYAWIEKVGDIDPSMYMLKSISEDVIVVDSSDNAYGFIPYVITEPYTVKAFGNENEMYPMLYPGVAGRIYERQSLMLTVMTTLAFRMANPQWAQANVPEGEEAIDLDFTEPNVYPVGAGQSIFSLNVPLNEYVMQALNQMDDKAQSASVSKIIAGQNPGSVTAASALNILSQGNKLQVVPVEISTRQLCENLAEMIFKAMQAYNELDSERATVEIWTREGLVRVDPDALPKYMEIDVSLDIAMPQDKAALVNMAVNAWKSGAVTKRTMHRWMGLDPDEEERQGELEEAKGIIPDLKDLAGGMSTQEGVLPQTPAANPTSAPTPEDNRIQQNVGGGAR